DPLDVEVVAGLVHQEAVPGSRQRVRDREPLLPAARERLDVRASVGEPGATERVRETSGPFRLVDTGQPPAHDVGDRRTAREDRVLRNVADADTAAQRARAAIGRLDRPQDLEEGGLAGPVRTDEAGLVAFEQSERQTVEETPRAVGLAYRLTAEQERSGHPLLFLLLRLLRLLPHTLAFRHLHHLPSSESSGLLRRRPGPSSARRPGAWCGAYRAARVPGRAGHGASSGGCPTSRGHPPATCGCTRTPAGSRAPPGRAGRSAPRARASRRSSPR